MDVLFLNCQRGVVKEHRENLYAFFFDVLANTSVELVLLIEVSVEIRDFFVVNFQDVFEFFFEDNTEHLTLVRKHISIVGPVRYYSFNKFLLYDKQRPKGMSLLHITRNIDGLITPITIAFGHWPAGPQPKARYKSALLHSNALLEHCLGAQSEIGLMIADTNMYAIKENYGISDKLKQIGFVDVSPTNSTYDLQRIEKITIANTLLSVMNSKLPYLSRLIMTNDILDRAYAYYKNDLPHKVTVESILNPALSDHALLVAKLEIKSRDRALL
jgi:hypothetical protein